MAELVAAHQNSDHDGFSLGEKTSNSQVTPTRAIDSADNSKEIGFERENAWKKPGIWGSSRRFWRVVQRYIWDDPDKPKEEKRFLLKLDFFLLTYGKPSLNQIIIPDVYIARN